MQVPERVFVVKVGYQYEGSSIIQVCSLAEEAIAFVERELNPAIEIPNIYGDFVKIDEYLVGSHEVPWVQTVAKWTSEITDNAFRRIWTRE